MAMYTISANIEELNLAAFYIHIHSHVKDVEGWPLKRASSDTHSAVAPLSEVHPHFKHSIYCRIQTDLNTFVKESASYCISVCARIRFTSA